MKKNKASVLAAALIMATALFTGCGSETQRWAYNHEPEKEIISLSDNGKAVYKGNSYTYSQDDSFINLKAKDGTQLSLRYVMEGDSMILYEKSVYQFQGDGEPDGIVGLWTQDNGWLYQFTEDGKFSEENIFYGYYSVDEENHSIKLMYEDPIPDAILYYSLDGRELTVDYPWPMVPVTKEKQDKK